ncbi:MAG: hypothetical protein IJ688_08140 [Treponema sp.]|nr:hypothetical protein [Treponema sp.]
MKELFGVIVFTIFFCLIVNHCSMQKVKNAYSAGREDGYKAGYAEVETDYKQKMEEQTSLYEKKIKDQQKIYEKKIANALNEGFDKGKKDKQEEVETNLQKVSEEKEKKGKWNDVLFDVNN